MCEFPGLSKCSWFEEDFNFELWLEYKPPDTPELPAFLPRFNR